MATIEIPDEMLADIKARAEETAQELMNQELVEIASQFVDITDLSTEGRKLRHTLTGKVLHVTAEWQDG